MDNHPYLNNKNCTSTYVLLPLRVNLEQCNNCNLPGAVQQQCQRSATAVEQGLEKSLVSERGN